MRALQSKISTKWNSKAWPNSTESEKADSMEPQKAEPTEPKKAESACHFLQLPYELRLMVYELLFPTNKSPTSTTILRVCQQLYHEAQPIFLSQSLFTIMPLRPPKALSKYKSVSSGLLDVIRPEDGDGDDERFLTQIDWQNAILHEFQNMFRQNWAPPQQYHLYAKDEEHRGPDWSPWAHMNKVYTDYFDGDELIIIKIDYTEETYYINMNQRPWDAHGVVNSCDMIRHNPFVVGLRRLGREKSALLKHLRILWGGGEISPIKDPSTRFIEGADSISMLLTSLLIRACLPNISHITLQRLGKQGMNLPNLEMLEEEAFDSETYLGKEPRVTLLCLRSLDGNSLPSRQFSREGIFMKTMHTLVEACPKVCFRSLIL
jgi:hypothetical protein